MQSMLSRLNPVRVMSLTRSIKPYNNSSCKDLEPSSPGGSTTTTSSGSSPTAASVKASNKSNNATNAFSTTTAAAYDSHHQFEFFESASRKNSLADVPFTPTPPSLPRTSSLLGFSPRGSGLGSNASSSAAAGSRRSTKHHSITRSSKLTRTLELAMQEKDYFLVVLELLSEPQSEFKLRLAWALVDLRRVDASQEAKKRRVLMGQITSNFLRHGSALEVDGLPPHLLVLGEDNCELMLQHLLQELCRLPEILASLEIGHLDESFFSGTVSEASLIAAEDYDLLAGVIGNQELKRQLLRELMASPTSSHLLVKIRFVAAIDQYEACEDKTEKRDLERMIRKIFLTKGGMFHIDSVRHGTKLEVARQNVLKELSANAEVCDVMSGL